MTAYVNVGDDFIVNSQTANKQTNSSIVGLADGGFVVVWQTDNYAQDASPGSIKAQRYDALGVDALGVAVGAEFLVNDIAPGVQIKPQVTALSSGGFVVTWETNDTAQDGYGTAIKARMFDAAGVAVAGEFRVNSQAYDNQQQPTITGLADGGFVVAWQSTDAAQDGAGGAVKAQRYDAAGAVVGTEFLVNSVAFGSQYNVDIASLANGGFIVTWQTGNASGTEISAQIYNADGTKSGGEFKASPDQYYEVGGHVIGLANGGFVVTWVAYDSAADLGIFAQVFDANGNKIGAHFGVNTLTEGTQNLPDVTALSDGGFMVTWESRNVGIRGQTFSATGEKRGGEVIIVDDASAQETGAAVAVLADGKLAVSWTHLITLGASAEDIRVQLMELSDVQNGAPLFATPNLHVAVAENTPSTITIRATDLDGPAPLSYSIAGGTDAARFAINSTTGKLGLVGTLNHEMPTDANGDGVYQVIVRASDGDLAALQTVWVSTYNVAEAPVITSNGGGASATLTLAENGTAVTIVAAADPEGAAITYSIAGGADAARFAIDAATGALRFVAAPNFEAQADSDANNIYVVTVRASDGSLSDTQVLSITVTNANEAPVFTSAASFAVAENTAAVAALSATDADGNGLAYAIAGGVDAALFAIDAQTGALSFVSAPDHEVPGDADGDNVYDVVVTVSDGSLAASSTIAVTVGNVNEAVSITSPAAITASENGTDVTTVAATDLDGDAVSFAIAGGADATLFAIDAQTGALSFLAAQDFEAPGDADGDGVYDVIVSASDGEFSDSRALTVTLANLNEGLSFTSAAAFGLVENTTAVGTVSATDIDGDTVTYAIAGGADAARFTVDAQTGALAFVAAPDHEAPGDADGDNVYDVIVSASDGSLTASSAIAIAVGDVNEGVAITSGTAVSASENATAVTTVTATDLDGDAIGFAIAGGADAARFAIDAVSGALSFVNAPNFETPGDADGDNVYDVIVSASDGSLVDTKTLAVTVDNVHEAPVITSGGGENTAFLHVAENGYVAATIAASSPEGGTIFYSILGEIDAALFAIDSLSGVLTFIAAPNYEAPADAHGDNIYKVVVGASDGLAWDYQALSITVGNVNEAPVITSGGGGASASYTITENAGTMFTIAASDPEGGVTYSIAGGADAARFAINSYTGALTFTASPDYDAPADAGGNNVYDVIVRASDGSLSDTQAVSISVGNVADGLTINGTSSANTMAGSYEEDTIRGLGGNDLINGLGAADTIDGGDGADRLIGGTGADLLTGGLKADVFEFQTLADSTLAASDRILDFNRSQGDRIDLADIDARTTVSGNQAFTFIGTAAFSNVAGQLRYFQQNNDTFVVGDVNGDGLADFQIVVDPLVSLVSSDFLL